jgi:hypothetical protein
MCLIISSIKSVYNAWLNSLSIYNISYNDNIAHMKSTFLIF